MSNKKICVSNAYSSSAVSNREANRGFIFMCNTRTKPQCYRYRVFGLPLPQLEAVQQIKAGSKLFLYDFDVKLLYGVYEATSNGALHLEPTAFQGQFPAQVSFLFLGCCFYMF